MGKLLWTVCLTRRRQISKFMLCCVEEVQEKLAAIDLFKGKNTSYELFLERLKGVHSLLLYQRNNNIIGPPRITKPQRLIYVILGRQAGQFSFKTVLVALLLLQL